MSQQTFSCPHCDQTFNSSFELDFHLYKQHPSKARGSQSCKPTPLTPQTATQRQVPPQPTQQEELIQEYSLAESKQGLGELDAVKVDKFGNIIDGFHRTGESANWRREVLDWIDTPEKLELARLAINFARRKVTDQELTDRLTFLIKAGLKPDEIAKITGIHIRKIYRHIPQDLKSEKSLKISEGMKKEVDKRKLQNVSSSINTSDNVAILESIPASTGDAAPRVRTFAEAAAEVAAKTSEVAESSFSSMASEPESETEVIPEDCPICPCCGASMDISEFEGVKQAVKAKFGKQIQTLLFPPAEGA